MKIVQGHPGVDDQDGSVKTEGQSHPGGKD